MQKFGSKSLRLPRTISRNPQKLTSTRKNCSMVRAKATKQLSDQATKDVRRYSALG
ncbi:hypothetical protein RSSM_00926 [Rhodopirellula sallentina SM41]|uniref:Uncharacterized protein n=1 Tax=Rhodopirellula sallentina SM41 TaxID=1263870 RepID=M5UIF3_9BACT|nr:hypothetical protein RSSM_00926 [Rhodopirellula sallentina SM41]